MVYIAKYRKWFYLFSGTLILIGLIAMGISINKYAEHFPVKPSIDFTGGSLLELAFKALPDTKPSGLVTEELLSNAFRKFDLSDIHIQRLGEVGDPSQPNRWQIRTNYLSDTATNDLKNALDEAVKPLGLQLDRDQLRLSQVSPTVGREVSTAAVIATLVGSFIVSAFIWFAFRHVPHALRYGVCAIVAMLHDILIIVSAMSIFGLLLGWEADALFVTALLTVAAYSVQDTIVVFDRIRENVGRHRGEPYELVVNRSIMETIARSLAMPLLVAFILVALIVAGGSIIRPFVAVLLVGLISGTYSSIFIGIPLLVSWERGEIPGLKPAEA